MVKTLGLDNSDNSSSAEPPSIFLFETRVFFSNFSLTYLECRTVYESGSWSCFQTFEISEVSWLKSAQSSSLKSECWRVFVKLKSVSASSSRNSLIPFLNLISFLVAANITALYQSAKVQFPSNFFEIIKEVELFFPSYIFRLFSPLSNFSEF